MSIERIDTNLCNGCGICVDTCTMDCIRLDTVVAERGEFPQCRLACPAGVDIRSYVHLLKNGMIGEAINILREALPLPAVTGRICPHPCESACVRQNVDEAVNINSLERFVADFWLHEKPQPVPKIYAAKVAIVGSGPAGLSSAYFLARKGYPVTVFEALPVLGGMLRIGVPEFRLPREVLDAQINYIKDLGVEFRTNTAIGKNLTLDDLKEKGYQAAFFALGAQLSQKLDIKGAELDGVLWGLDFLRDVNLKRETTVKDKTVVVIGGGNVAVTAALAAVRLRAKDVQMVCLERRETMPAYNEEIGQALEERIEIHPCWGPKEILGKNQKVTGVELLRCIKVFDEQGQFNPCFDEQGIRSMTADVIILAVGQAADLSLLPKGMKTTEKGTIQVDPVTLETTLPGIFAGGDVVSGLGPIIEAVAAGQKTAVSIDRYLKGEDLKTGRLTRPNQVLRPPHDGIELWPRQTIPLRPVDQRRGNFEEVRIGFDENTMMMEARRCMTCGSRAVIQYPADCMLCVYCERDCPQKAIYVSPEKKAMPILAWG